MWGLIIASGVCGLLFGRYFNPYTLIPATLVITGIACFLASKQGLAIGALSLVLATVAMHSCYFLSAAITIFMDNFKAAKAPSEEYLAAPITDHGKGPPQLAASFIGPSASIPTLRISARHRRR
jgi:hypothetical protein